MFEKLYESIAQKVSASPEELSICTSFFMPKKLKKRMFLLQEGDVCNRLAFVETGALYCYATDAKGVQHVMQFALEGSWIADLYSFLTQEPSKWTIEALEDTEVLLIDRDHHQQLLQQVAKYESYTRILYQNAYVALQRRMEETIGHSAEEKYTDFLKRHPKLLSRVPLHLIASYLDMTPETLSRVRKQMTP
jgi:CRP-like cAMP-binding protein